MTPENALAPFSTLASGSMPPRIAAAWARRALALVSQLESGALVIAGSTPIHDRDTDTLVASLCDLTEIARHAAEQIETGDGEVDPRWLQLLDRVLRTAGAAYGELSSRDADRLALAQEFTAR
jgi:hypothetical protein